MTDLIYRQTGFEVVRKSRQLVRGSAHYLIDYVEREFGWCERPFPIAELLELWSSESGPRVADHSPNLDIYDPEELPHAGAEFVPHENLIRVNCDIWDSACNGDAEARLVLAHETGHVVLKHYARAGLYRDAAVDPETDSEHQANWFADELLMDNRRIDLDADGVEALVNRFGVSSGMARRRIRDLILDRKR